MWPKIYVTGFWQGYDFEEVVYFRYLSREFNAIFLTDNNISQDTHVDLVVTSVFGQMHPHFRQFKSLLLAYEDYQRWGLDYKNPFDLNTDYAIVSNFPDMIPFSPRLKNVLHSSLSTWRYYPLHEQNMMKSEYRATLTTDNKTDFCSFCFSNPDLQNNGVKYRNELFEALDLVKHVDSRGKYKNNAPDGYVVPFDLDVYSDWNKKYKFTLTGENMFTPGYYTEKIMFPYYSDTVPIYCSDSRILEFINPKSMIHCGQDRSYNDVIKEVIEVDTDPHKYLEMLRAPVFLEDKIPDLFDIRTGFKYIDEIMYDMGFEKNKSHRT